jgi:hypothetical protein
MLESEPMVPLKLAGIVAAKPFWSESDLTVGWPGGASPM